MNYIVFDLEWNQPADGLSSKERELLFEIIEIGAVKLDSNLNKVDEFSEIIRPKVYRKLNWHTQKMLKISMKDLEKGDDFETVYERFIKWCGKDVIFCSWGTQDLTELQRNMNYYNIAPLSNEPIPFYNVQAAFADYVGEKDKVHNLELAVDMSGIEKDIPFHRAFSDAYYTAKIFQLIPKDRIEIGKTYDLYHIPSCQKKEIKYFSEDTLHFISCGYDDRSLITGNRRLHAMTCEKCNRRVIRQKIRWFSSNSKNYYAAAICIIHGPIKGKIKVRQSENGLYYVEKTLTYTDMAAVDEIREKKKNLKKK